MEELKCRGYAGDIPVYCAHDKIVPVSEVKPNPKNPNQHPEEQIELLAKIIKTQGWRAPITVSTLSGLVVRGHGRLMAAQHLGLDCVPVDFQQYKSMDAELADLLADNKIAELAEIDSKMLAEVFQDIDPDAIDIDVTGYSEEEYNEIVSALMDAAEPVPGDMEEDEIVEVQENALSRLGDIWLLGKHRLMCGDSTDTATVAKLMNGCKADMVFTDPPYGVSYTGGLQFKDGQVIKNNREMIKNDDIDIYSDVFRILSEFSNGACYVWFAGTKASALYHAAEQHGEIHALIVWVKNGGYGALNANYKQKHEPCLYWKPTGCKLNFVGATTETTVWEINKDGVNEYHPTQKPVALPAKAINNHDAKSVLDLFGGSGSTLIACEQLNRTCYMMELDPRYVDVIVKRYIGVTGKTDVVLLRDGEEIPVEETGILD